MSAPGDADPRGVADKSELWWVSVGGNDCEPARVLNEGGQRVVYTVGCNDGTPLTDDSGIDLVRQIPPIQVPMNAAQRAAADLAWEKKRIADAKRGIKHNYRRFV